MLAQQIRDEMIKLVDKAGDRHDQQRVAKDPEMYVLAVFLRLNKELAERRGTLARIVERAFCEDDLAEANQMLHPTESTPPPERKSAILSI